MVLMFALVDIDDLRRWTCFYRAVELDSGREVAIKIIENLEENIREVSVLYLHYIVALGSNL